MEPIIWQEAEVVEIGWERDPMYGDFSRYVFMLRDASLPGVTSTGKFLIAVASPESGIVPTVVCPDCDGAGKSKGLALIRPMNGPCYQAQLDCSRCATTGVVDKEMLEWMEDGERLRQDRLDRRVGQSAEARRRGMSPVDLSKMEHGYLKPVFAEVADE